MNHESNVAGHHPGRARRAVAAVAKAVGLGLCFTLAAAGGVILHLGMPAPTRFAVARVNEILATTFKGKVTIQRLGVLRLTRLDGLDAKVQDPAGRPVLELRGVRARFGTLTILTSLVSGKALLVHVPELTINDAEIVVEENDAGDIGLLDAFDSVTPSTGGKGTDVTIDAVTVHHAWAHGHLAAVPVLDADLEELAAGFVSTPDTTNLDVHHLFVRGRALPGMNPEGTIVARAELPADEKADRHVRAHYDGKAGAIPLVAEASLDGKRVSVVADVPETDAAAFNALAPDHVHLGAPVSAHAEVHGELPVLKPELHARVGEGEVTVTGTVTLPEKPRTEMLAAATVSVKDLDLSVLSDGAPASKLTAKVDASVISRPGGKLSGSFDLENQVGELSGQVVPAASVKGDFTEASVKGTAFIAEIGAPTTIKFDVEPHPGGDSPEELTVNVVTDVPDLDHVPRSGPIGRGRVHLVADGHLHIPTKQFAATATVDLAGIDAKGVKLTHGTVKASAEGTTDAQRFAAGVSGYEMSAGGYLFPQVNVTAKGTPKAIDVTANLVGDDAAPVVAARAHVTHPGDLVVEGTSIQISRDTVKTTTSVASVRVAGGTVDVRGVHVEGLGDPIDARAHLAGGAATVVAKATDVDIACVAELLARESEAKGHLSFDIDATASKSQVNGRVAVAVKDLSARGIEGASVRVSTAIDGRRLHGEVAANLGKAGKLDLTATDVTLGGAATDLGAWKTATGNVALDGTLDLQQLLAQLPEDRRPVKAAAGVITLKGKAARASLAAAPTVELGASTQGLAVTGKQELIKNPDGTQTLGPMPFSTQGLDGSFSVSLAPTTGRTQVSFKVHDEAGTLVALDAGSTLPLAKLVESPGQAFALLGNTPITAKLVVPRRSFDKLPPALGKPPVKGAVELTADLSGTTRAPRLTVNAQASAVIALNAESCVLPVELEAKITYDGEKAVVHVGGSRSKRDFFGADADVRASLAAIMNSSGPPPWDAAADVTLTAFPLDAVAPLVGKAISGQVSGKVKIADLHRAGSVDAQLDVRALELDHAQFPDGKVRATIKDGKLVASVRLDQADGFIETKATGAMAWGTAIAPSVDFAKAIDVDVQAKNFRADAAMPFVQSMFSELDGRVDTNAQVHVEPGGKDGHVKGEVTLRDGSFEVPQLGERFHGLGGKILMDPWGTIKFTDFAADAPTGHLTLNGQAVLKGMALQSAKVDLHIAKGQSIPIALEGVSMGRAYGDVKTTATMTPDGKRLDVKVDVPLLRVDLPQSTGHTVQPTELDKTIRVGLHTDQSFVTIPLVPPEKPRPPSDMAIHAAVTLGQGIEVKRDTTLDVFAHGNLDVLVTDKSHITGKIGVERGKLELEGKIFIIDRGVVTMQGADPANPMVVATAHWDAPDATRVYADFSGMVSSGKLNLHSEPPLSQDEILSLILFGSADGTLGSQPPPGQQESTGAKAAGMAGSVVTEGLNKAISGITSVDISTRVDTSDANNPQPQLAVQITKDVSAKLGYKLGVPAPGENTDRTELTLDWRFIRDWSVVAVVGDQGSTSLDLVWRKRY